MSEWEDRESLNYVRGIVKELLRCTLIEANWFKQSLMEYRVSYSSTGYPHSVVEDDEYMGYKIPRTLPL